MSTKGVSHEVQTYAIATCYGKRRVRARRFLPKIFKIGVLAEAISFRRDDKIVRLDAGTLFASNRELAGRTQGRTDTMIIETEYRLLAQARHIEVGEMSELLRLGVAPKEIVRFAQRILRWGLVTQAEHAKIREDLSKFSSDFTGAKRNANKVRAGQHLAGALGVQTRKGEPHPSRSAMKMAAARPYAERRLDEAESIRGFYGHLVYDIYAVIRRDEAVIASLWRAYRFEDSHDELPRFLQRENRLQIECKLDRQCADLGLLNAHPYVVTAAACRTAIAKLGRELRSRDMRRVHAAALRVRELVRKLRAILYVESRLAIVLSARKVRLERKQSVNEQETLFLTHAERALAQARNLKRAEFNPEAREAIERRTEAAIMAARNQNWARAEREVKALVRTLMGSKRQTKKVNKAA